MFLTYASFFRMNIYQCLTHSTALFFGVALGAFGTQHININSYTELEQNPSLAVINNALSTTNAVKPLPATATLSDVQPTTNLTDISDSRQLLQVLTEIAQADSSTLYSIANNRLLHASALAPANRVITTAIFQRCAQVF